MPSVVLGAAGFGQEDTNLNITGVGSALLSGLWIVFTAIAVIMLVIAGILFLTAQGNPEQVSKARSAFLWGVVGVVVAIIAYSIIAIVGSVISLPTFTNS